MLPITTRGVPHRTSHRGHRWCLWREVILLVVLLNLGLLILPGAPSLLNGFGIFRGRQWGEPCNCDAYGPGEIHLAVDDWSQCPGGKPKYLLPAEKTSTLDMVMEAFHVAGYRRTTNMDDSWEVLWSVTDPYEALQGNLESLQPSQRINAFPGTRFTSKAYLAKHSEGIKNVPVAFLLPEEYESYVQHTQSHPNKLWVVKSSTSRGVHLTSPADPALKEPLADGEAPKLVQEFIANPHLIDGRKWDIGAYAVLTNVNPLRVYLHEDILLRFSKKPYSVENPYLTDAYVIGEEYVPAQTMRSLEDYFRGMGLSTTNALRLHLDALGEDTAALFTAIRHRIVETLVKFEPAIYNATLALPSSLRHNLFQLFRFDFTVDASLTPWLMEVNRAPNLSPARVPADKPLYAKVIGDTLSLVGVERSLLAQMPIVDEDVELPLIACLTCGSAKSCSDKACRLCRQCRGELGIGPLKDMVAENVRRRGFHRVWPAAAPTTAHASSSGGDKKGGDGASIKLDSEPLREKQFHSDVFALGSPATKDRNVFLRNWVSEKCWRDPTWC
eukprot:jgi/Mesvir1/27405/Mv07205-RA.1